MARNYNNPITHSGVVSISGSYPKHTPVYETITGDALYLVKDYTFTNAAELTNSSIVAKNYFPWKPTINPQLDAEPRINEIRFGDGYSQRLENGVNTQLQRHSLKFEKRSDAETQGILHFLHEFGGVKSFNFVPPFPYQSGKFVCKQWNFNKNFKNNNTISATFEQVPEV